MASDLENSEIALENIRLDRLTKEYVTEIKKSDADEEACKWQLYYYLYILKKKGIIRKGKLEFVEKNKKHSRIEIYELNEEIELELKNIIEQIQLLLNSDSLPDTINKSHCKKCAYYEYCYI